MEITLINNYYYYYKVEEDAVKGAVDCVGKDEMGQAINEMKT